MTTQEVADINFCSMLRQLREQGWAVACHNDYFHRGVKFTFWLFTHPNGKWIKGEGLTDHDAVQLIMSQVCQST